MYYWKGAELNFHELLETVDIPEKNVFYTLQKIRKRASIKSAIYF